MGRTRTTTAVLGVLSLSFLTLWCVLSMTADPASAAGGSDWSSLASPTADALNATTFSSGWKGWAVGANGTIVTTADGTTWTLQNSGTGVTLRGVDCLSDTLVWACGGDGAEGVVRLTTDGGLNWSAQTTNTTETLRDIDFSDSGAWGSGWAVGDSGTILHTTDFGDHWAAQSAGTSASLQGVQAMSDQWACAVGAVGETLWTSDGGADWISADSHTSLTLVDVSYGDGVLAAVGEGGTVLRSADSGVTWRRLFTYDDTDQLLSVYVYDRNTFFAGGAKGFSGGLLYVSHTAGAGWYQAVSGGDSILDLQVPFATFPGPTGWAVGAGGMLLQTTDGGGNDVTTPSIAGTHSAAVARDRTVVLRFRAVDPDDTAIQTLIKIRTLKGKLVKTLRPGWRAAGSAQTCKYHCTLARGTYRYYVYGLDNWGNRQTHAASARLVVK